MATDAIRNNKVRLAGQGSQSLVVAHGFATDTVVYIGHAIGAILDAMAHDPLAGLKSLAPQRMGTQGPAERVREFGKVLIAVDLGIARA